MPILISRNSYGLNTNDSNVTAGKMLLNKTAYNQAIKVVGNIPSKTAQTFSPSTTNQTIAGGQHLSGTQTILGDSNLVTGTFKHGTSLFGLTGNYDTESSNPIQSSHVLNNYVGYVNGIKVIGNIQSVAGGTYNPSNTNQVISLANKYLSSNIVVNNQTINPSNIVKDVVLFGYTGSFIGSNVETPYTSTIETSYESSTPYDFLWLTNANVNKTFALRWSYTQVNTAVVGVRIFNKIVYSGSAQSAFGWILVRILSANTVAIDGVSYTVTSTNTAFSMAGSDPETDSGTLTIKSYQIKAEEWI